MGDIHSSLLAAVTQLKSAKLSAVCGMELCSPFCDCYDVIGLSGTRSAPPPSQSPLSTCLDSSQLAQPISTYLADDPAINAHQTILGVKQGLTG